MNQKTRVLLLGGGFGGMYAALHLDRIFAQDPDVEITLINRENYFLFTPMLHEVAASDLNVTHIVNPIRQMLRRIKFIEGEVETIDLLGRRVHVTHGSHREHQHELGYDHLVLALGSGTNFFGIPGLSERAITMRSLGDAIYLRNRLIGLLEEADAEAGIYDEAATTLTVLVAGGGFAGVETIAAVNDFLRESLRFYPHLSERMVRTVLVHAGPYLLPELGVKLGRYAQQKLAARGVEVRVETRVTGMMSDSGVELSDGTIVPAAALIWTAGTAVHPLVADLPCQRDRGRIVVDETLTVPDWPGVWALGDCALVPDRTRTDGVPCPPTAQYALRQGTVVAHNIAASIRGGRRKAFVFGGLGQLAALGRRTGVANVLGVHFSGFLAWWLWRTVYLSKLPRFEKKLRVALDWTLDLIFSKDLVQFATPEPRPTAAPTRVIPEGGP